MGNEPLKAEADFGSPPFLLKLTSNAATQKGRSRSRPLPTVRRPIAAPLSLCISAIAVIDFHPVILQAKFRMANLLRQWDALADMACVILAMSLGSFFGNKLSEMEKRFGESKKKAVVGQGYRVRK